MRAYTLTHLSDRDLLRDLAALVEQDRSTTAALLAHVAETDARRLYVPAGYASMYEYCVHELRLSEQAALKRIRAGRTARRFPAVFAALADGKLHLSAVVLLTPFLTPENVAELLAAVAHSTKSEIEGLLAQRFPRPDLPARLQAIAPPMPLTSLPKLSPGTVEAAASAAQPSPALVETVALAEQLSPGTVESPFPKVKPLSPQRFALQLTIDRSTHDKLRYAQSLLSHQLPSGDMGQVLDRALDALIGQLEKRKFAATDRPRTGPRPKATGKRTIPAHVKRAVWERDRGQCTFVANNGHRCSSRTFLEFDHIDPVARGGEATVKGMRLRCRAHNQHEAECTFGAGFMNDKREARRCERARAQAAESDRDVMAALRTLGFRTDESRRATVFSESLANAPLEERVRLALSYFRPRASSRTRAVSSLGQAPGFAGGGQPSAQSLAAEHVQHGA